ncbi:hypothetical protein G4Y73_11785 [Wenzhouxiangella sp. XN201]|uniref:hypothetical protein n=1 Tax=Wenzhouxiangella sp. XN201 TaxID=2710755 RepID=UPI0013CDA513|nr:hypothetical protein [Wenzhouxiangella sp. XN201]NEZ04832.1 hypothetical protein [Wenzhouxiangella sp. XN201]
MDERIDFTRMQQTGPPEDLWPAIAEDLDRRGKQRFLRRFSAVAAMVAVVVLATVMVEMPAPPAPGDGPTAQPAGVTLADLQATSAQLESRLADQRQSVVEGIELEALLWLETELAWLDEQLADSPADRDLWRQRIVLLQELNRRYAEGDWRHDLLLASV